MSETPISQIDFLKSLGWNDLVQAAYENVDKSRFSIARVMGQGKGHYHIQNRPHETFEAAITTKFHGAAKLSTDFPTVGDWVIFEPGIGRERAAIHEMVVRKSCLQRTRAKKETQLIAANADFMLIVTSANEDFELKRIGRYVALGKDSRIAPVILLTKTDLCEEPDIYLRQLKANFPDIEAIAISSESPESIEQLRGFFGPGITAVLLGSSGVGKSTLTNYLLGFQGQKTQGVSYEARGRHTTTSRDLRFTSWGGLVMDTPGMQEIAEVVEEEDIQKDFSDVEELTLGCKFTNCLHVKERGCKIQESLKDGSLGNERWTAYLARSAAVSKRGRPRT